MDNELIITGAFLSSGLLAYVIIPGLLVMWDRVLDHMEQNGSGGGKEQGVFPLPFVHLLRFSVRPC